MSPIISRKNALGVYFATSSSRQAAIHPAMSNRDLGIVGVDTGDDDCRTTVRGAIACGLASLHRKATNARIALGMASKARTHLKCLRLGCFERLGVHAPCLCVYRGEASPTSFIVSTRKHNGMEL